MIRFWNRLKITQKFIGYLVFLTFIPLIITGFVSYQISSNVLQEEAGVFVQTVVTNQMEYLDLQLRLVENLILNLSGVEEIRDALESDINEVDTYTSLSTQARIGYILNGYINLGGLVSIDIFAVGGTRYHVGDTLNTDNYRQDVIDGLFEQAIANGQDVTWIGVEDNVNTNSSFKKVITATRALYRVDPETLEQVPIALLIVNYSTDFLYQHFSDVNLGHDAYVIVTDTANRAIYHPDPSQIGEPLAPAFAESLAVADSPSFITRVNGRAESISVATSEFNGFSVIGIVPINTLTAQTSIISFATLLVLSLSSVIALIAAYYFNRFLVTPIKQITYHFERFGGGQWENPVVLRPQSDDEIADLIRWFNVFVRHQQARQLAEAELQVAKEAAESANRSKSIFLTNVSHELRTPLNVILGFTQLIKQDPHLSQSSMQRVNTILHSGHHLLDLINDVLDMSRIEAGKLELQLTQFDLHNTLMSLQSMLVVGAEAKHLDLQFHLADDLPRIVEADEKKFRQVIINLVNNAIKFTDFGYVRVMVNPMPINGQTYIECIVEDSGIGIDPADFESIFQPFSRAESNQQEGTGLGLSICRRFIALMDGEISVNSEIGRGTRFTFFISVNVINKYLPDQDHPTVAEFDWHPVKHSTPIVVAEDHQESQELMLSLLEAKGFNVLIAENGLEAIQLVKRHRPQLVFMDIQMPVMDGYKAIEMIRTFDQDVVIIVVTAGVLQKDEERITALGGNVVLYKPFDHRHFYHVLAEWITPQSTITPTTPILCMPDDLRAALSRAIIEINVDQIHDLVEQIAKHDQNTAATVRHYADAYRFDILQELFVE